jgi:hypothetical protein
LIKFNGAEGIRTLWSALFGSGHVLLAFLRADLVERWHWLTNVG